MQKEFRVKKNLMVSALFLTSIMATSSLYATLPPLPLKCPGVMSIQSVGVSVNTVKVDNAWFAGRRNQMYDTTDHWTFILGNIQAADTAEAYAKAVLAMVSLNFQVGPQIGSNKWVCLYNTLQGYPAIAITTPIGFHDASHYLAR